jgi:hypothetical protein
MRRLEKDRASLDAAKHIAPIRNLESISDGDHFVQFYEEDRFLEQAVASYVAQGFVAGESVILILTPEHRREVERRLAAGGVDPVEYQRRRLYYAYDAAETLSCFMVHGQPNARAIPGDDRTDH